MTQKQVRSGLMSSDACEMAIESLSNRIEVFNTAISMLTGNDYEFDDLIVENARAMADESDGAEQLQRIRSLLIEAKEALEASA